MKISIYFNSMETEVINDEIVYEEEPSGFIVNNSEAEDKYSISWVDYFNDLNSEDVETVLETFRNSGYILTRRGVFYSGELNTLSHDSLDLAIFIMDPVIERLNNLINERNENNLKEIILIYSGFIVYTVIHLDENRKNEIKKISKTIGELINENIGKLINVIDMYSFYKKSDGSINKLGGKDITFRINQNCQIHLNTLKEVQSHLIIKDTKVIIKNYTDIFELYTEDLSANFRKYIANPFLRVDASKDEMIEAGLYREEKNITLTDYIEYMMNYLNMNNEFYYLHDKVGLDISNVKNKTIYVEINKLIYLYIIKKVWGINDAVGLLKLKQSFNLLHFMIYIMIYNSGLYLLLFKELIINVIENEKISSPSSLMIVYIYIINSSLKQNERVYLSNVLTQNFNEHRREDYVITPFYEYDANDVRKIPLIDRVLLRSNVGQYVDYYDRKIIEKGLNMGNLVVELNNEFHENNEMIYKKLTEIVHNYFKFINLNRGCTRIIYDLMGYQSLNNKEDYQEICNLPVWGSYIKRVNEDIDQEMFRVIRNCSISQIKEELNDIKKGLGSYYEINVILYVETIKMDDRDCYKTLNLLADNEEIFFNAYKIDAGGCKKCIIPLKRFNMEEISLYNDRETEFYEEYNKAKDPSTDNMLNFSGNIKRIEINIGNFNYDRKYVAVVGRYLPLRIKSGETNDYLEEIADSLQLVSKHSELNLGVCCFIHTILHTPNIKEYLTEKELEALKFRWGKNHIGREDIQEFSDDFKITVEIIKIVYLYQFLKINRPKTTVIPKKGESRGIIRIGFIKYGSFTHYFPIIKTNITKYCCKYLNISNKDYYDVDSRGNSEIDNYEIIVGKPARSENIDKKIYAESDLVLEALINQNKLELISKFDDELYNFNINELPPDLELIKKYPDIMTEEIEYIEINNNKHNCLAVADTETYFDGRILVPFCICMTYKKNNKIFKKQFYGEDCQTTFLTYCERNGIYTIYFHNLKFDGWLFKNFMIRNIIYHGSRLYQVKILVVKGKNRLIFELRDSLALIPTALRNFPKMFGLSDIEKEMYPYDLITKESVNNNFITYDDLKEYFKDRYNEFISQYNKNIKKDEEENKGIDIRKLTLYYCQNDCDLLLAGLDKFEDLCLKAFDNINPLNYLTISSYSYSIMVINCFNKLSKYRGDIKNYIRKCIRGGRCMVADNTKIKVEGEVVDFDACSLYPSAMKRLYLPTGECYCCNESENVKYLFESKLMKEDQIYSDIDRDISFMIIHVKILKVNKKRKFPLLSYHHKCINIYSNEVEGMEMYLTSIEVEDFIKYQDGEVEFIDCIYWKGNKDIRMSKFIEKQYNLRREYKKVGNPIQEVLKLFMNSAYGKTIQKDIKEEYLFKSKKDVDSYIRNNHGRIKEVIELNENTYWIKLEGTKKPLSIPCHIGALILGMSKRIMNEVICTAEDNDIPIYYQDTDSIHMNKKDVIKLERLFNEKYHRKLIGSEMGQFHIDFPLVKGKEPVSKRSIFLGKKAYLDCLYNEDGDRQYFIRMKGVPEDVIINTCDDMNISVEELYERMYEGSEVDFNLLNSDKPKFDFTKDFQIMVREKFSRKVKF